MAPASFVRRTKTIRPSRGMDGVSGSTPAGKGSRRRCPVDPDRGTGSECRDPAVRLALEPCERGSPVPAPDLRLPAAVERLDGGLEAGLTRWGEDRHDAQREAHPDHGADRIRLRVAADEPGVVVELGIGGEALGPPPAHHRRDNLAHPHPEGRPRVRQAAMEADPGQDPELRLALQAQPVHHVEAVELAVPGGRGPGDTSQEAEQGGGPDCWPSRAPRQLEHGGRSCARPGRAR